MGIYVKDVDSLSFVVSIVMHYFQINYFIDAGIVVGDGIIGLYLGFVPNALKNLPNSRYLWSSISGY